MIHAFCFVGSYVLIAVGGPTATITTVAVQAIVTVIGAGVAEASPAGDARRDGPDADGSDTISRRLWIME